MKSNFVYVESAQGKRWASSPEVSGSYSTGQDCCELCAAKDQNTRWASYALPSSAEHPNCRCRSTPSASSSNEPATGPTSEGDQWGRGTCRLPQDFVYNEVGTGNKYAGGMDVGSTSYTTGQECCDLCHARYWNTLWISWVRPGSSTSKKCVCRNSPSSEPSTPSNAAPYADFNYGSCQNKYVYDAGAKRKRRDTLPWEELDTDLVNIPLMDRVNRTRHARAADLTETQDELDRRSYGSRLRYECGLARMFWDPEEEILYQDRMLQCNWNQSWTRWDRWTDSSNSNVVRIIPNDPFSLDECVWTHCLDPPQQPPETRLAVTWLGDPVEFYDNASYICPGDNLFFEWDRDMVEFNVTCLPGGAWEQPDVWPVCVPCKWILPRKK